MAKKQFKAESKRLLEMMINSIYTNKEIFLRELISNASDALDKRHYLSLTDSSQKISRKDLTITIEADKANRTLVIEDTGIGMTEEELEKNLGTIAKSGSAEFRAQLEKAEKNIDIIGQFGVGFYSAFMVSKRILVETLSAKEEQAYSWSSSGEDGYIISPITKETVGTRITLSLKEDTEDENYSEYLEEYKLRELVKKYSDYVRYPIRMEVTKSIPDPTDDKKTIDTKEMETLNSMVPLWKKQKKNTTNSTSPSSMTGRIRRKSFTTTLKEPSPIQRCCSFLPAHRTTSITRTLSRVCSFTARVYSSLIRQRIFCRIISASSQVLSTAMI